MINIIKPIRFDKNFSRAHVDMEYIQKLSKKIALESKNVYKRIEKVSEFAQKSECKGLYGLGYYFRAMDDCLESMLDFVDSNKGQYRDEIDAMRHGLYEALDSLSCSDQVCRKWFKKVSDDLKQLIKRYQEDMMVSPQD